MVKTAEIQRNALKYSSENINRRELFLRFNMKLPMALELGIEDEIYIDLVNIIDYFQYHYIRYLTGRVKTLHRVFTEAIILKGNGYFDSIVFYQVMAEIESYLIEKEMYESLELYKRTFNRIKDKVGLI